MTFKEVFKIIGKLIHVRRLMQALMLKLKNNEKNVKYSIFRYDIMFILNYSRHLNEKKHGIALTCNVDVDTGLCRAQTVGSPDGVGAGVASVATDNIQRSKAKVIAGAPSIAERQGSSIEQPLNAERWIGVGLYAALKVRSLTLEQVLLAA